MGVLQLSQRPVKSAHLQDRQMTDSDGYMYMYLVIITDKTSKMLRVRAFSSLDLLIASMSITTSHTAGQGLCKITNFPVTNSLVDMCLLTHLCTRQ